MRSLMFLFHFIIGFIVLTFAEEDHQFNCKPKPGCNFSKCDPIPSYFFEIEGFDAEEYRRRNNYHILCQPNFDLIKGFRPVKGDKGEMGVTGPQGPKGAPGNKGDPGRQETGDGAYLNVKGLVESSAKKALSEIVNLRLTMENIKIEFNNTKAQLKSEQEKSKDLEIKVAELVSTVSKMKMKMRNLTIAQDRVTVRLLGRADKPNQGRVEAWHEGEWGAICGDWWGREDARVVCRQLGFKDMKYASGYARSEIEDRKLFLLGVSCSGDEENIGLCKHRGWGREGCSYGKIASVICVPNA